MLKTLALIFGLALGARAAELCTPGNVRGTYGFQLTGETTISGDAKLATAFGRLDFDGEGNISGTSSVKYAGLLLGNPVTGTYEAHPDCTVIWSLRDDSGGMQHFSGVASTDGRHIQFKQSDPGGARNGVLVGTGLQSCSVADLRAKYAFTLSGKMVPMTDGESPRTASAKGVMQLDNNQHLRLTIERKAPFETDVAITVESDCTTEMNLQLPVSGDDLPTPVKLRGILVDAGKQILAIQTDPGAVVSARFTAQ